MIRSALLGSRRLTAGEIAMQRAMFGNGIDYDRARIHPYNMWWPFPNVRAISPNGSIYFAPRHYRPDFSASDVPLRLKALFMHESTHVYQWYGLGWWVWLRGPFDRNYSYELVPGRIFHQYGLEQMGMIVEHYYTLLQGGVVPKSYTAADYETLLPLRRLA